MNEGELKNRAQELYASRWLRIESLILSPGALCHNHWPKDRKRIGIFNENDSSIKRIWKMGFVNLKVNAENFSSELKRYFCVILLSKLTNITFPAFSQKETAILSFEYKRKRY